MVPLSERPGKLGVPRLVVVQLGHHLADIAVHIDGDFPVLRVRESVIETTLTLHQILPYSSSLHSQVCGGA